MKEKIYKPLNYDTNSIHPGDLKRSPDESFSEDTLVFIDANFLSKLSKHFGNGNFLVYDLIKFSENLSRKQKLIDNSDNWDKICSEFSICIILKLPILINRIILNCKNIFYYTAPPFQSSVPTSEEEKKNRGYGKFINKLKKRGVVVREGRCQRLKCDDNFVYKQKAVDILLTMDLMSVPIDYPKVKRIILVSSDSDFVPVVESLEEKGVKIILYTYYEKIRDTPFSVSNHLIKSVHKYVQLTKEDFDNSPLKKRLQNEGK